MQCIRCGKEMTSSSGRYDYCYDCKTWQPSNCDIPMPQGFGEQKGWICPVCGRGVAPWANYCPCQSDWKITYGTSTTINNEELNRLFELNNKKVDEMIKLGNADLLEG